MTTLQDIKALMLNFLKQKDISPTISDEEDDAYYDDCGHCGPILLEEIMEFWNNFNSDKDLIYLVSGEWWGETDLSGGRSYLLSVDGLKEMLFEYLYSTMNYSKSMFENVIHNSIELNDEISDMYDDISAIRDMKIGSITNAPTRKVPDNRRPIYNPSVDETKPECGYIVLKYPKELKQALDNNKLFEFVGLSKIDNVSPIYKLKVPAGFEVVRSVTDFDIS